jgi:hypothetical protein
MLKTVLSTRKNECSTMIMLSFDLHDGNAMRKKIARNCLTKEASTLGFVFDFPESGGK